MKTTIKTGSRQIIVQPCKTSRGSLLVQVLPGAHAIDFNAIGMAITLTQDQAGALIFALEQAAEVAEMTDRRVAA